MSTTWDHRLRGLYVIIDHQVAGGRDEVALAQAVLEGGASILQWRDKTRPKGLQLPVAEAISRLCREAGVPFIVNDHLDLALACGAQGVHLGQHDLPVAVVRRLAPRDFIVGCSTNNVAEALRAQQEGADYVSVGRLFPTASKVDTRPATLDTLRAVKGAVRVPVCAIGGIDESNVRLVLEAGADMVAVIGAVVSAPDPREATLRLAFHFRR
jgi:thiamine-phosphate diphosphorylase